MKINPSVKVSVIAILGMGAVYAGYQLISEAQLAGFNPSPLVPGEVNMVAFKTNTNLRIRVANQVAQLVELSGNHTDQKASAMDSDVSDARRIPIRDFLQSLQGNEKALGKFITSLNSLDEEGLISPLAAV